MTLVLGEQTGRMAARVLRGELKAGDLPFETISEAYLYLNLEAAEKLGITLSSDCQARAKEIFTEIATP